ncbi:MAG: LptF/LptG family permease [Firmicutes bacterium]|nr:LptF/LptG family permease [Bacillota bacterium]
MILLRVLDRYMLRQLLLPLLAGILIFSGLLLGDFLVYLARAMVDTGMPFPVASRLLLYRVAGSLSLTFPMSVLLATLLSLSRLSAQSEIIAMQAGGVSFLRLVAPVWAVGLVVSLVALGFGDCIAPRANLAYNQLLAKQAQGSSLPQVTQNVMLKEYENGRLRRFLYAASFDPRTQIMDQVVLLDLQDGRPVRQVDAERLYWRQDGWYFRDGRAFLFSTSDRTPVGSILFRGAWQKLDLQVRPADVTRQEKTLDEMTMAELRRQLDLWGAARGQVADSTVRNYAIQYYQRWAIPFASLAFALLGAPLGIQSVRSATSVGFGVSVLIIFGYYLLLTLAAALGQGGTVSPAVAAWLPNLVLWVLAGFLTYRASQGRTL